MAWLLGFGLVVVGAGLYALIDLIFGAPGRNEYEWPPEDDDVNEDGFGPLDDPKDVFDIIQRWRDETRVEG